jgi:inner membrane protein
METKSIQHFLNSYSVKMIIVSVLAILQLQDYALLAGSIGLFLILAIIMRASQQIKWYPEG